ncbi:MAG: DUF3575 domain-containing protein [Tannerellaceae bacterium]|nr:DUF3575 domain-containing protein [Tannerellaceae bacterium]
MFILVFIAGIFCLPQLSAQRIGVKSNILYDFTTTLNFGLEVGLAPQWTIDLPVNYNPWVFSENMKLKHWLIQPEVRYWFCEKFMGHFVGLHAHTGEFNVGGIKWLGMKDYRYQGTLYGAGLSYGYQWLLNTHWSLEATIGLGYAYLSHAKYPCEKCATKIEDATTNYFGPTKLGVSLIYIMK